MSAAEQDVASDEDNRALEVFVLAGPTACGKSAAGLLLAERMDAEIISLDSMKVYLRMDIGTDKPSAEARRRVPHHLLDVREPWEGYTVHDYVSDAEAAARLVRRRGRRILFEGGTPLYLKAFLDGLFAGPPPDPELRARLEAEADLSGLSHLHGRLVEVDPVAGQRIHPNDKRRIVRALEVYEQTGVPISELQRQFGTRRPEVRAHLAALRRPREELGQRIRTRIDSMLARGWLQEAKELLALGRPLSKPASGALGYRELWAHLRGEVSREEARERIASETWRFMRRQLTWLRSFGDLVWVDGGNDPAEDAARIERAWRQ
jgi:tRNA dimethylallyltransferase